MRNNFRQLRKYKKFSFEDNIKKIKTEMNYDLLSKKVENGKHMEYYGQTVKLIIRFIE